MGALPGTFPGYQSVTSPEARAKFAQAWGVDQLPGEPGMMSPDALAALPSKKVRGFMIVGENLANSEPNIAQAEHELSSAEFLVCVDIFPTETTRFAHVILPAAAWSESEGTYTNSERRVSRVRQIKEAPGQARPGWWIARELARRMGRPWRSNSAQEIWDDEVSVLAPAYAGIKYARLEGDGLQWPCPSQDHPGTRFLHKDGKFSRGQGLFQPIDWTPPAEVEDEEYPFVLSSGRRLYHYHTRTQTGRAGLDRMLSEETADISSSDAARLGVADGEYVRVSSRRGSVKVRARITDEIPPGLVWMAFHFREGNANWLTNNVYDPNTKTAEYKACAVKIEKLN
jgi:formate dehydrogenase major subunit